MRYWAGLMTVGGKICKQIPRGLCNVAHFLRRSDAGRQLITRGNGGKFLATRAAPRNIVLDLWMSKKPFNVEGDDHLSSLDRECRGGALGAGRRKGLTV